MANPKPTQCKGRQIYLCFNILWSWKKSSLYLDNICLKSCSSNFGWIPYKRSSSLYCNCFHQILSCVYKFISGVVFSCEGQPSQKPQLKYFVLQVTLLLLWLSPWQRAPYLHSQGCMVCLQHSQGRMACLLLITSLHRTISDERQLPRVCSNWLQQSQHSLDSPRDTFRETFILSCQAMLNYFHIRSCTMRVQGLPYSTGVFDLSISIPQYSQCFQ